MHEMEFIKQFIKHPRTVGAVIPSSKQLAKQMIAPIQFANAKSIVEYGPGTGLANPVQAFAKIVNNDYITFFVSVFIVLGAVGVNLVANIVPAAYIIQLFTKVKYKVSVVIAGLLAMVSFPWKLIQPGSSDGLRIFILTYSAFLAPITAILVVDYLILCKQKVDIKELYNPNGQFSGLNMAAVTAMIIGAASPFIVIDLGWPIGLVVGGISYYLLNKFGFKQSVFKKGTIFDK